MAKKFIINYNRLILGDVKYHRDLLDGLTAADTIGGGYWYYDHKSDTYYFYGSSQEFGQVTLEDMNVAEKPLRVMNANLKFSDSSDLFRAFLDSWDNVKNL